MLESNLSASDRVYGWDESGVGVFGEGIHRISLPRFPTLLQWNNPTPVPSPSDKLISERSFTMLLSILGPSNGCWGRVGLFQCECGCGQTFFRAIRTRYPRYVNKTHRARAYRARARARAEAQYLGRTLHFTPDDFRSAYVDALRYELSRNRGRE